jgi:hypothetical protein
MNVNTITIEKDEALSKLAEYRKLNRRQIQPEDTRLRQLYQAVSKGARVINIFEAFKATGVNELGQPKLAIARADWPIVHFDPWGPCFSLKRRWGRHNARTIAIPQDSFPEQALADRRELKSAVPHIPPGIRPKIALSNFHILFEVEKWETYPVDPFLMRHISGGLYIVVAEWELTELEASLLGSMRTGN